MFGFTPDTRTLEAALRDIGSAKPNVRADAIRDLTHHAEDARGKIISALDLALRKDQDSSVRAAAALALADIKATEALSSLLVSLDDTDSYVCQMAITALGEIGDSRASQRLERALKDDRPAVRFQAVMAFPRVTVRKQDAADAILHATYDTDPLVAHIALRMAEELGANDDDGVDPRMITRALVMLDHSSHVVRGGAAVLLARVGHEDAHPTLVQVVTGKLSGVDEEDEAAAIELCGELGLDGARAALERRAFGGILGMRKDSFSWHARVALARMGHAKATREILQDLHAWDRHRRTLAVAAAGKAKLKAARQVILAMRGDAQRADPHAVDEALNALDAQDLHEESA